MLIVYFNTPQEFKGYAFKIIGGCDKQGFPMKQGVLTPGRVRLLLHRERRRKSVRGFIVSPDLSVLNSVIKPRLRGPKRASKILKPFNLSKEDDVRKYVTPTEGKKVNKAPKIQRLVTPLTLQRKRARIADKKKRLPRPRQRKDQRQRRSESLAKARVVPIIL
ncbi:hypothetical protein K2173_027267 [Erythroxylum novogranatense]|uniref:40S ribosomal protein S6 n=1 Tax=Erythroxylum novogranatense TaxID=1862640 RepID=A0AAV8TYQ4_9ROSI|nr:hypothetical protein K2173_027267 [Erythroxylum novogranatense]